MIAWLAGVALHVVIAALQVAAAVAALHAAALNDWRGAWFYGTLAVVLWRLVKVHGGNLDVGAGRRPE